MRHGRLCIHRLAFKREAPGSPLFLNRIPVTFLNCMPLTCTGTQRAGASTCASPFGELLGTALGVDGTTSVNISILSSLNPLCFRHVKLQQFVHRRWFYLRCTCLLQSLTLSFRRGQCRSRQQRVHVRCLHTLYPTLWPPFCPLHHVKV